VRQKIQVAYCVFYIETESKFKRGAAAAT